LLSDTLSPRYFPELDCFLYFFISSIDDDAKEKLQPFSNLTGEESYQSRDLEKVFYHYMQNCRRVINLESNEVFCFCQISRPRNKSRSTCMTSKFNHRLCFPNKLATCILHPFMLHWHLYYITSMIVW